MKTYTARDLEGKIIYENKPSGNLFGELPLGARPIKEYNGKASTLYVKGTEDEWEEAYFETPSGRIIIVKRD